MKISLLPAYILLSFLIFSCASNKDVAQMQKDYEATSNELLTYKAENIELQKKLVQLQKEKEHSTSEKAEVVVLQNEAPEKVKDLKEAEAKTKS